MYVLVENAVSVLSSECYNEILGIILYNIAIVFILGAAELTKIYAFNTK